MKKIWFLLTALLPIMVSAQEDFTYFDPAENIDLIYEDYSNGKYEDALEIIRKIDIHDSLYNTYRYLEATIYLEMEAYEKVIALSREQKDFGEVDMSMRLTRAVSHIRLGQYEPCIEFLDQTIKLYPVNYLAYFNRAIAYEGIENYENAIHDLEMSILLNPFYAGSHLELGKICYNENLISQAMMCFNSYLYLEPVGESALGVLSLLNTIVSEKNDAEPYGITVSPDDEAFREIDLMISNYTALNKKYKITNDIDLPLVRQNQALMEMLQQYEGNDGFWSRKYVPFYKAIYESGYLDPFLYRIMASTTNEQYQKKLKKNEKSADEFIEWSAGIWITTMRTHNTINGNKDVAFSYFDDGECSAIGKEDEKGRFIDSVSYFYEDGNLKARGLYSSGNKTGKWLWYYPDGSIDEIIHYKDDKWDGLNIKYNQQGYIIEETEYTADAINGFQRTYTQFGVPYEEYKFVNGIVDGMSYRYHSLGEDYVSIEIPFSENKVNGIAKGYYTNGQLRLQIEIKEGVRVGEEFHYFSNGMTNKKLNYVNGQVNGPYQQFFDDGKIMEEGQYKNDNLVGEWKTYYRNGNIESISHYNDKGEFDGIYETFNLHGKPIAKYVYSKGKLITHTSFNREGKPIKEIKTNNRQYLFETYYSNEILKSKGSYTNADQKDGQWNYYDIYGALLSTETFSDGKLTGTDYEYYVDGSIKSTTLYEDGVANGLRKEYYIDGTVKSQYYYVNDEQERNRHDFYPDGTITRKTWAESGKLNGIQYEYSENGNLFATEDWQDGIHYRTIYFDTAGIAIDTHSFFIDSVCITHYPNGKIRRKTHYKNGIAHGEFIWYYLNGQKETIGEFFDGERTGDWLWYFDDGSLYMKGQYVNGNREKQWITYHENGEISNEKTYFRGALHGPYTNFSEEGNLEFESNYYEGEIQKMGRYYGSEGQLQMVRYYDHGELLGYSYLSKDGELVPIIPLKEGTGQVSTYHQSGSLARNFEYYKGMKNGEYRTFHSNGKLQSLSTYRYGERYGASEDYYLSGQKQIQANYLNDELHGAYITYYPNGQARFKSQYINGQLSGWAEYFHENGQPKKKEFYVNGLIYDAEYYK